MFASQIIQNQEKLNNIEHLVEFPELYDFIYKNLFSYEDRKKLLYFYEEEKNDISILGCGSGLFVEKVQGNYEKVVSIDKNTKMLELCRKRTSSKTIKKDIINNLQIGEKFQTVTLFGNVTATLTINQIERLFDNLDSILQDNGLFIFDFINTSNFERDDETQIIKGNGIEIHRNPMYDIKSDRIKSKIEYEVIIKNDRKYDFTEFFSMRRHSKRALENKLQNKQFHVIQEEFPGDYERDFLAVRLNR